MFTLVACFYKCTNSADCNDQGTCDTVTGVCNCNDGYSGTTCSGRLESNLPIHIFLQEMKQMKQKVKIIQAIYFQKRHRGNFTG